MNNYDKYEKMYFMPPEPCYDWVKKDHIDTPPSLVQCGFKGWEPGVD